MRKRPGDVNGHSYPKASLEQLVRHITQAGCQPKHGSRTQLFSKLEHIMPRETRPTHGPKHGCFPLHLQKVRHVAEGGRTTQKSHV